MKTIPATDTTNVVNLPPVMKKSKGQVDDKWSPKVMKLGFTVLPNLLLQAQARLKISPVQFNVLVQLFHHWWDADRYPFLSKETLATRIGKSPRQVQRYITQLEKKGFVTRQARFNGRKAQTSNIYSFEGLVAKLKALEPEFTKAAEQARLKKRKLEAA